MTASGDDQLGVLEREAGKRGERGDCAVAYELERRSDLHLFDVFGEIAAGHTLVDMLVTGERAELFDARLDVVAGHPLARFDRR